MSTSGFVPCFQLIILVTIPQRHLETLDRYSTGEAHFVISVRCLGTYLWSEAGSDEAVEYAARHWPTHVERLDGSPHREDVMPLVLDLLTRDDEFDCWVASLEGRPLEAGPGWSALLEAKLRASASVPPSPLFIKCCFGLMEVFDDKNLLEEIDVTQKNKDGTTAALYLESRFGHLKVCRRWRRDTECRRSCMAFCSMP